MNPMILNHLLRFDYLDTSLKNGLDYPLYSLAWRIIDDSSDFWTSEIISFKDNDLKTVKRFCSLMPQVLQRNIPDFLSSSFAIFSAIPSKSTSLPSSHQLYSLCSSFRDSFSCFWDQSLLKKKRHESLHYLKTASERDSEVAGTYICGVIPAQYRKVMLVDDLATRGSTFYSICQSIKRTNSHVNEFLFISAGKNERLSYRSDINNSHLSQRFKEIWCSID